MKMTLTAKLILIGGLILVGGGAFKGYQDGMNEGVRVIDKNEAMIVVPQLQYLGQSRESSVNFCVQQVGVKSVDQVMTDSQLDILEGCLIDLT